MSNARARHDAAKTFRADPSFKVSFYQRRPYTVAIASVESDGYSYLGVGVSKVSGKDWFSPKLGKKIARGRAVDCIVRQIFGEGAEWALSEEKAEPYLVDNMMRLIKESV